MASGSTEYRESSGIKGKKINDKEPGQSQPSCSNRFSPSMDWTEQQRPDLSRYGSGKPVPALLAGAMDAAVLSVEARYIGLDKGMKEMFFFGE
jgi:hypothetical protein